MNQDDKELLRRDFFGALFARVVEPVFDVVEKKIDQIGKLADRLADEATPSTSGPPILRPPGVLSEAHFLKACQRTNECVAACPVKAIRPMVSPNPNLRNTPHIIPEALACVLCEEMACIAACPSGALLPTPREKVRMGLAVVHYDLCLRADGEECRVCLDRCPLGERAIRLDGQGAVEVVADGCTGCGVCVMVCPAPMRAVAILPHT